MTSRRTRKAIVYTCDYPHCKVRHVAATNHYGTAWAAAKAAGWCAAQYQNKWKHFCSWVHRPRNDRQMEQADRGEQPGMVRRGD